MRKLIAAGALAVALFAAQAGSPTGPDSAQAVVRDISVSFGGKAYGVAGERPRYAISFRLPQGFYGGNDEIMIEGPPQMQFPPLGNGANRNYWISTPTTTYNILGNVHLQPGGNKIWIEPKNTSIGVPMNGWLEVQIGAIGASDPTLNMLNPTTAGKYQISVMTTRDAPGWSGYFDIVAADPAALQATGGSGQRAFAGQEFEPLVVRARDQYGNAVSGQTVRFALPEDGPSGEFETGGRTAEVATNAEGYAISPAILASEEAGAWQATAELPDWPAVGPVAFGLENLQPGAKRIDVAVDPPSLVADGVGTAEATASLIDALDEPLAGQELEVEVDGDVRAGEPVDNGDGTYAIPLAVGTTPGEVTITVRDPESGAEGTGTLELEADTTGPAVAITKKPRKRLRAKKAKRVSFRFASGAPDLAGFECRFDKKAWRACTSPAGYRVKRGRHRFAVRAFDHAGNRGPEATATFSVKPKRKKAKRAKRKR